MVNLIGISAKISHGKDTVGSLIRKQALAHGVDFEIKKFAFKLKQIVANLTGCNVEDLENESIKNEILGEEWWYFTNGHGMLDYLSNKDMINYVHNKEIKVAMEWKLVKPTRRLFLQLIGTEAGRNIVHPNVRINSLFVDYNEKSNWIITDTRFPNEMFAIKNRNGIVVRVERPSVGSKSDHPSETALDNCKVFDYKIMNDGSISDLEYKVYKMLKHFEII